MDTLVARYTSPQDTFFDDEDEASTQLAPMKPSSLQSFAVPPIPQVRLLLGYRFMGWRLQKFRRSDF